MSKKEILKKYEHACRELSERFLRYREIITNGTGDPFWSDGINANLVCNHIDYYKEQLKELHEKHGFKLPNEYYLPTPSRVDDNYMAPNNKRAKKQDKTGILC